MAPPILSTYMKRLREYSSCPLLPSKHSPSPSASPPLYCGQSQRSPICSGWTPLSARQSMWSIDCCEARLMHSSPARRTRWFNFSSHALVAFTSSQNSGTRTPRNLERREWPHIILSFPTLTDTPLGQPHGRNIGCRIVEGCSVWDSRLDGHVNNGLERLFV